MTTENQKHVTDADLAAAFPTEHDIHGLPLSRVSEPMVLVNEGGPFVPTPLDDQLRDVPLPLVEMAKSITRGQDVVVDLDERRMQPSYQKSSTPRPADHPLLKFFRYEHLNEHLRAVSKPFGILASEVTRLTPHGAEQTVALRKLLEAKDAAVRAALEPTL